MKMMKYNEKAGGFTLVELLIALAIFGIVIGAIYGIFVSQRHAYDVQDQVVEMEQSARAATNMILRELRMAGHHAMGDELINNLSNWVPSDWVPDEPLTVNLDANPKITAGVGTEPDMITFLAVLQSDNNPTTLSAAAAANDTQITLSLTATETDTQYNVGDIIHIGTCSEYAKVTGISGSTLTIDTNPTVSGNQGLSESYSSGIEVGEISVVTYTVFNETNDPSYTYHTSGHPVLKRKVNDGSFQPIAENITDMQISSLGSGEIQFTISARTDKPDPRYSANSGYRTLDVDTRVKVRNAAAVETGSTCNVPAAPTNLTLIAGLNNDYPCQIRMQWDAVTTDSNGDDLDTGCEVTEYRVYYDTSAGMYGNSVDPGNVTTYTLDVSALEGCTYYVSVAARNSGGIGDKSTEQSITDAVAPAAPTGLTADVSGGDNQVNLAWSANSECDLAGYNIYRSTASEGPYTQINSSTVSKWATDYTDSGLLGCQTYYYYIEAVDSCPNTSPASSVVSATTTDSTAPAAPTDLTLTTSGGTNTLDWTVSSDDGDGANDVVSYRIYGDGSLLTTVAAGTSSYSTSDTYATYEVSAVDNCDNESEKASVSETSTTTTTTTTTEPPGDTTGPTIENITQDPDGIIVPKNTTIEICADVTDPSGVSSVTLHTTVDGDIAMTLSSGDTYCGSIPKHNNQTVTYYIIAVDSLGNETISDSSYYDQSG